VTENRIGGGLPRDKLVHHSLSQGDRPDSDRVPSKPRSNPQGKQKKYSASVIFSGDNLMQLSEFTRSATLRWTLLVAGIFAAFVVALLEFVYLKTKND